MEKKNNKLKKKKIIFVISDIGIGGAQKILLFLASF